MKTVNNFIIIACLCAIISSCTDLNVIPKSTPVAELILSDSNSYKRMLAKIYSGLAISGQSGEKSGGTPTPDIANIDENFGQYLRQYFKAQELTTDEAVIAWNDGTLPTYHTQTWTSQNEFVAAMYNRVFQQVSISNYFLRVTTDNALNSRGFSDKLRADIKLYRAEARFLRALSYWHGLDLFGGNIPFYTEDNTFKGTEGPSKAKPNQVFEFIESELLAIESDLQTPKGKEYGRVGQAAAWTLLAKLYLNAKVYTGTERNTDCITYCNKVISSGAFMVETSKKYAYLFRTDNYTSKEFILTINFDAQTQASGGMTFLTHAAVGGVIMKPSDYGIDGGWWGLRATKNLVNLFPNVSTVDGTSIDGRAMFFTNGQTLEINAIGTFSDGYALPKYQNISSTSIPGTRQDYPDTDFPLFRLADVYLMYAEAVLRGGSGGDVATAVTYINILRERAYGNTSGAITAADLDLPFILDERARELQWECHRRTDLIRFGEFTTATTSRGIWPWKGGEKEGISTESYRNIFPIPIAELVANPNLTQNPGY